MKHLKNPNGWSCLPTSFAIALGVSVEDVLSIIGHDGSEITHPLLKEPQCRRGFHPQEMIKMCLCHGLSVTSVELYPQAASNSGKLRGVFNKQFDTGGWTWFKQNLFKSIGVIQCKTMSGSGHAMAYEGKITYTEIHDPASGVFNFYTADDAEKRDRFLVSLWRIDMLEAH